MSSNSVTNSPAAPVDPDVGTPTDRWRHRLYLVAWAVALAVTMWTLVRLGQTELAAPPVDSVDAITTWVDQVGTATAVFALVRLAAIAATAYLIVMTVIGLAARATKRTTLIELADVATVPALRQLLSGAAGVGLTISSLSMPLAPLAATFAAGSPSGEPLSTIEGERFGHPDGLVFGTPRLIELDDGTLSISPPPHHAMNDNAMDDNTVDDPVLDDREGDGPARPGVDLPIIDLRDDALAKAELADRHFGAAELLDGRDTAPLMRVQSQAAQTPARAWTAEPGDHLWTIAARTLDEAWGRKASDAEVALYWVDVIAHNRFELADPENPDLVFPGQVFHLPAPPDERGRAGD